jgi:hypothetical protein
MADDKDVGKTATDVKMAGAGDADKAKARVEPAPVPPKRTGSEQDEQKRDYRGDHTSSIGTKNVEKPFISPDGALQGETPNTYIDQCEDLTARGGYLAPEDQPEPKEAWTDDSLPLSSNPDVEPYEEPVDEEQQKRDDEKREREEEAVAKKREADERQRARLDDEKDRTPSEQNKTRTL